MLSTCLADDSCDVVCPRSDPAEAQCFLSHELGVRGSVHAQVAVSAAGLRPALHIRCPNLWRTMAETFAEAWPKKIWPIVKNDLEDLLLQRPAKQDTATGTHYGKKVLDAAFEKGECRNVTCNLAWTPPVENTPAQKDLSLDVVSR